MVMKSADEAKANLEAAISYIPDRYKLGVGKADWKTNAASAQAETNYATAVAKAVTAKSRQAAINKITNEEWRAAAIEKGAPIIGERIRGALDKYDANFRPKYTKVQGVVERLPPKTTDPMQNIDNRLKKVVKAWVEA